MDECAAGAVFAEYIIESVLGRGAIGAFGAAWPLDFGTMVMRKFSEGAPGRPVLFSREDADRIAVLASGCPMYDEVAEE
jgi:hypothetical protein